MATCDDSHHIESATLLLRAFGRFKKAQTQAEAKVARQPDATRGPVLRSTRVGEADVSLKVVWQELRLVEVCPPLDLGFEA